MEPLPPVQAALLAYLREYIEKRGMSPSINDICERFGYASPRAAAKLLEKLQAKGCIEREPNSRRAIRVVSGPRPNQLPLLGRIAAGRPLTSGEQIAEYIDIRPELFQPTADILFRVSGQSMIGAGVLSGDLVGVRLQNEVRNGQIVAAVVTDPRTDDAELTLKTYRRRNSIITLTAENEDQEQYPPLVFDTRRDAIQIVGLYCGLLRVRPQ